MKPGALVAALLCSLVTAPTGSTASPPIYVMVSERLSLEALIVGGREQVRKLRILAALAEAEAAAGSTRIDALQGLDERGHSSKTEVHSASIALKMAEDRAGTLISTAREIEDVLDRLKAAPQTAPQVLHLKLPSVSRRIGSLEFFTLPVSTNWLSAPADVPAGRQPIVRGHEEIWSHRLAEIRRIPSVRETEVSRAERDLLAARSSTEFLKTALEQQQREAGELRAFATCPQEVRSVWPMTREDIGVFVSSWHRPVPATAPFLSAALPLLRAMANARGGLELRNAEVAKLARRLALLTDATAKGFAGMPAVLQAQCALHTAQSQAESERLRLRVRELELNLFLRLAQAADVDPAVPSKSPVANVKAALDQASCRETAWVHGLLQLAERRAIAALELRDRAQLEEQAALHVAALERLPSPREGELISARENRRIKAAQRLVASDAVTISELEWSQWIVVEGLVSESTGGIGIPADVLEDAGKIAAAEVALAREWANHFRPESTLRNGLLRQLEELNQCGSSSDYEVAMALQQSLLAQAKWSAAQQDIFITEEQQRLASHLMNQQGKLMNPGDLSATAKQCLTTLNQLQLQPRASEIAGLEAAAAMASARGKEFSRLVDAGYATPHEARKHQAFAANLEDLIVVEKSRSEVASLAGIVLQGSFHAAPPLVRELPLPALE